MKIEKFEDIIAWQKAKDLTVALYSILKNNKDFSFRDQLQRSSVSIMNNIAEGFERKTNNEFKHFLFIAKGSAGELRSMLYLAKELKYMDMKDFDVNYVNVVVISKMLSNFIKTL